jgi:hypothetical protein
MKSFITKIERMSMVTIKTTLTEKFYLQKWTTNDSRKDKEERRW